MKFEFEDLILLNHLERNNLQLFGKRQPYSNRIGCINFILFLFHFMDEVKFSEGFIRIRAQIMLRHNFITLYRKVILGYVRLVRLTGCRF